MRKEELIELMVEVCESDMICEDLDQDLIELGLLDSLAAVSFIVAVEEKFGLTLSPSEIGREDIASINKAYQLLLQKGLKDE